MIVAAVAVARAVGGPARASALHRSVGADGRESAPGRAGSPGSGKPVDAAAFASGACVAFTPTSGNRRLTVFLDAGHGGVDPGAVGTTGSGQTIDEADGTLGVELDATAILRRDGFRVVVSRTGDTTVARLASGEVQDGALTIQGSHDDVAARDICANEAHANVLVGIYFDAGTPDNAGSVTAYDADRPFAGDNLRLATLVQADVLAAMNSRGWAIPDEGVAPDSGLGSTVSQADSALSEEASSYGHLLLLGPAEPGYFTTPSQMPGALIEPLFLTDPFEASIAASATGQQVIAGGLALAVEQYFAPPPAPPRPTAPAGSG